MNDKSNEKLTKNAQELRKNMTKEEKHLWYDFLKYLPVTVHRQKVIGKYIVDFYIAEKEIAIELDGSQHYTPENREADKERDAFLKKHGIAVLRYTNIQIHEQFSGVCEDIMKKLSL